MAGGEGMRGSVWNRENSGKRREGRGGDGKRGRKEM